MAVNYINIQQLRDIAALYGDGDAKKTIQKENTTELNETKKALKAANVDASIFENQDKLYNLIDEINRNLLSEKSTFSIKYGDVDIQFEKKLDVQDKTTPYVPSSNSGAGGGLQIYRETSGHYVELPSVDNIDRAMFHADVDKSRVGNANGPQGVSDHTIGELHSKLKNEVIQNPEFGQSAWDDAVTIIARRFLNYTGSDALLPADNTYQDAEKIFKEVIQNFSVRYGELKSKGALASDNEMKGYTGSYNGIVIRDEGRSDIRRQDMPEGTSLLLAAKGGRIDVDLILRVISVPQGDDKTLTNHNLVGPGNVNDTDLNSYSSGHSFLGTHDFRLNGKSIPNLYGENAITYNSNDGSITIKHNKQSEISMHYEGTAKGRKVKQVASVIISSENGEVYIRHNYKISTSKGYEEFQEQLTVDDILIHDYYTQNPGHGMDDTVITAANYINPKSGMTPTRDAVKNAVDIGRGPIPNTTKPGWYKRTIGGPESSSPEERAVYPETRVYYEYHDPHRSESRRPVYPQELIDIFEALATRYEYFQTNGWPENPDKKTN